MIEILFEEKWISVALFSFLGISLALRLLLGFLYKGMIREADNMAITQNPLLRQCKLKFANCYQMNNGVSNIPIFVDKFISRLSLGSVTFDGMYHFSGQAMLLSIVCAGVGIAKGIATGKTLGQILPYYIVSLIGLYLYFSVSSALDIKAKKRTLKINLIDYLENHLSARIDVTKEDLQMLYGEETTVYPKRRVELMPVGGSPKLPAGRFAPIEAAGLYQGADSSCEGTRAVDRSVTERMATDRKSADRAALDNHVSEEELEALLKEFLAM